jgi:hypothetical protein
MISQKHSRMTCTSFTSGTKNISHDPCPYAPSCLDIFRRATPAALRRCLSSCPIGRLEGGSWCQSKTAPPLFDFATSFLCHLRSELPMKSIGSANGGGCGSGLVVLAHLGGVPNSPWRIHVGYRTKSPYVSTQIPAAASIRVFSKGTAGSRGFDASNVIRTNTHTCKLIESMQDGGDAYGPAPRRWGACRGDCCEGEWVWAAKRHVSPAFESACTGKKMSSVVAKSKSRKASSFRHPPRHT